MSQQRKKRDNIFDNFSNIDDYIAAKDADLDVMDPEEGEMDGEGEIDSMFEHYRFPVDKGQTIILPSIWRRLHATGYSWQLMPGM